MILHFAINKLKRFNLQKVRGIKVGMEGRRWIYGGRWGGMKEGGKD